METRWRLKSHICAVTGEFPAQIASNVENVCIWWRHHGYKVYLSIAAEVLIS